MRWRGCVRGRYERRIGNVKGPSLGAGVTHLPCPDPDGIISPISVTSVECINTRSCFDAKRLTLSRRSAASAAVIAACAGPAVCNAAFAGAIAIPACVVDADIVSTATHVKNLSAMGRLGNLAPVGNAVDQIRSV